MLVPANWQVEGSAYWANPRVYFHNEPSRQIRAFSPTGFGIAIGPVVNAADFHLSDAARAQGATLKAEGEADMGRIVLYRPYTMQDWTNFYREKVLSQTVEPIEQFEFVQVAPVEELAAVVDQMMGPTRQALEQGNQINRQMNFTQSCDSQAVGIETRFFLHGQAKEAFHLFVVTAVYTDSQLGRRVDWNVVLDVSFMAPRGQLENRLPQLVAIANSVREVPNWSRLKAEHLATMKQIQVNGFAARSRIMSETFAEISRMRHDSFQRKNAISDSLHAKTIDSIRDVQVFQQGGSVYELPTGYSRVFGDGQGNFILTDDQLLQPNVELPSTQSWQPLQPIR